MSDAMKFALLLTISNAFMTMAWNGHLKHKSMALWSAILMSWGIAFAEYLFQVPANRIGSRIFSVTQLKVGQECITLAVFGHESCHFILIFDNGYFSEFDTLSITDWLGHRYACYFSKNTPDSFVIAIYE